MGYDFLLISLPFDAQEGIEGRLESQLCSACPLRLAWLAASPFCWHPGVIHYNHHVRNIHHRNHTNHSSKKHPASKTPLTTQTSVVICTS